MIFVALGTQKFQFNRLLKYIEDLIDEKIIQEEVLAQSGYSTYRPQNYKCTDFLTSEEYDEKIKNCSIFITHGGVGSITTAMKHRKKIIVCPRLARFGEHVDDHQLEISNKYKELGIIHLVKDKDELLFEIRNICCEENKFTELKSSKNEIIQKIMLFLEKEDNYEN